MGLIKRITVERWTCFVFGCLLMLVSGTQYLFSVYAPNVKVLEKFSQQEINLVATFANLGVSVGGVLPGIFYDYYGAKATSFIGSLLMFTGYFVVWLFTAYEKGSAIALAIFFGIMGLGSSACFIVALTTNLHNFPVHQSGTVVGVLYFFFGISAATYTQLYDWFFWPDFVLLLFFEALTAGFVGILGTLFLRAIPPVEFVPQMEFEADVDSPIRKPVLSIFGNQAATEGRAVVAHENRNLNSKIDRDPPKGARYLEVLKSVDFWMAFYILAVISGAAFVVINNIGALVMSLGGESGEQDGFVKILSLSNAAGRVIGGIVSDRTSSVLSRPFWLIVGSLLMAILQFILAYTESVGALLATCVAFVGFTYGSVTSIAPLFVGEQFGESHFGGNWAMLSAAPGLGSLLFSWILAGVLYDRVGYEIEHRTDYNCVGIVCFRTTFFVMGSLCILCAVLSGIVAKRFATSRQRLYHQFD